VLHVMLALVVLLLLLLHVVVHVLRVMLLVVPVLVRQELTLMPTLRPSLSAVAFRRCLVVGCRHVRVSGSNPCRPLLLLTVRRCIVQHF
jgi:hypothetical protein